MLNIFSPCMSGVLFILPPSFWCKVVRSIIYSYFWPLGKTISSGSWSVIGCQDWDPLLWIPLQCHISPGLCNCSWNIHAVINPGGPPTSMNNNSIFFHLLSPHNGRETSLSFYFCRLAMGLWSNREELWSPYQKNPWWEMNGEYSAKGLVCHSSARTAVRTFINVLPAVPGWIGFCPINLSADYLHKTRLFRPCTERPTFSPPNMEKC